MVSTSVALVVEDEDDWGRVLTDLLQQVGCSVVVARTASEALETCRRAAQPFALVVVDVRLEHERDDSGILLVESLTRGSSARRWVVVTSLPNAEHRLRVERLGATYLPKSELSRERFSELLGGSASAADATGGGKGGPDSGAPLTLSALWPRLMPLVLEG